MASTWRLLGVLAVALGLTGCGPGLPCEGPEDCGGSACCYVRYTLRSAGDFVSCTSSAAGCADKDTIDKEMRRLCQTDDDCVAGGISTNFTKCCRASVLSRGAKSCTSPGLCPSY